MTHVLPYAALALACAGAAHAQSPTQPPATPAARDSAARRDSIARLDSVKITAARVEPARVAPMQRLTLPVTVSVTAQRAEQTVNLVDAEDAVKYLPSVFLRKRNNGDTQATMATRTWGVSSSARSLIFADGVPLTALVANNNTIGGPRWGLVSPEEIARIDMMYGPFSAAYAGNSMGAVMEITTRMPEKLEGSLGQTQALQRFDLYGTRDTYSTAQTTAHVGNRLGKLSFWASGNYQISESQPLTYVTSAALPIGTTGGFAERNKLGAPANVLGATGLLHTRMANGKLRAAYDLTPWLRAAYTFGLWRNDGDAAVDSYVARAGQPTYAGQAGFASGYYDLEQRHSSHSLSLRSDTRRDWDVEAVVSRYHFDADRQRTPTTSAAADTTFGAAGRVAVLDGTGWWTADLRGAWHRGGPGAIHTVTFGLHQDQYRLFNPTYNTPDWRAGSTTTVATEGDGRTRTQALWAQDRWLLSPTLALTVGGRFERWRAYDGYNANGATQVVQPERTLSRFSPKAILAWTPTPDWTTTVSAGRAYRFATPAELYQLVSTGATFTSPDPDLKPDDVLAAELRVERRFGRATTQLALFQDDVHDAIIGQFLPLVPDSPTLYSYLSNVDHVRARGAELVLGGRDLLVRGLEVTGSATYLDARTLALSGRASATAPAGAAVGKFLPNIPKWRGNVTATYRPIERLALTAAGRYSGKLYTTLDNADVNPNTYQGFSQWFVADARAHYQIDRHWSASLGVDNLLDRKYFLFHPFPQRTIVASARVGL
jgi:iron complex outermembrane receptor protein